MTDKLEKHRAELREIAADAANAADAAKKLLARRTAAVSRARKAGMTIREASILLGMTEHGLIKAAKTAPTTKSNPTQKRSPEPAIDESIS